MIEAKSLSIALSPFDRAWKSVLYSFLRAVILYSSVLVVSLSLVVREVRVFLLSDSIAVLT